MRPRYQEPHPSHNGDLIRIHLRVRAARFMRRFQQDHPGARQFHPWPGGRRATMAGMIASRPLPPSELAAYHRDGYHIGRGLFNATEVADLLRHIMELASAGPCPGLSSPPPGLTPGDPLARFPRMMHPHVKAPAGPVRELSRDWMIAPRLRPILAALMEDEPVAAQSMIYFKPAGARGQQWHQDNYYLSVAPGTCMAAWIALDPSDAGNGGLSCVRGSHRLPTLPARPADLSISMAEEAVDLPPDAEIVEPVLAPGDVLFFNGQLIHGSGPNRSRDRMRRSLICHYLPASSTAIHPGYWPAILGFDGKPRTFSAPTAAPAGKTAATAIH